MSGRPTIAFAVASDEVCRMTDVREGARVWHSRGFAVDVFGLDSGQYPPPRWDEPGIRFRPTRAWGTWGWRLLRALAARPAAQRARTLASYTSNEDRASGFRGLASSLRTALGRWVTALDRTWMITNVTLRMLGEPPRLIIALDMPSVVLARIVHAIRDTPYVYQPRELACGWDARTVGQRLAKVFERLGHRAAARTFTYDQLRGDLLVRDDGIDPRNVRIVPNAPTGLCTAEYRDRWRWPFELPPGAKTVLYAGSVIREHMVAEIVESVASWPPDVVLIVHGRIAREYRAEVELAASHAPGRVFFSETIVPDADLDLLYASADVGVAFYRPVADNFRFVGKAAGKIFHWMKVGVPVVVNDLPGMRDWIEGDGVGRVVASAGSLGDAVLHLAAAGATLREHCRATFGRYEFGGCYGELVDRTVRELALDRR